MCQTRIAELELIVVGCVDAEGVLHAAPVLDTSDMIYLSNVALGDGEFGFFEAEAYHLPQWCEDMGIDVYRGHLETEVVLEKE